MNEKTEQDVEAKAADVVNKISAEAIYAMAISMVCFTTDAYDQPTDKVRGVAKKMLEWADAMDDMRKSSH